MFELYNFKLYKFWVANSYTLQAVLEQTLMSRGTPLPTNHIRRGLCIRVFQINDNNEFYAGALSIDKHSSPLQLVSIILKVDNFQ